jgi:hypothetical protein
MKVGMNEYFNIINEAVTEEEIVNSKSIKEWPTHLRNRIYTRLKKHQEAISNELNKIDDDEEHYYCVDEEFFNLKDAKDENISGIMLLIMNGSIIGFIRIATFDTNKGEINEESYDRIFAFGVDINNLEYIIED